MSTTSQVHSFNDGCQPPHVWLANEVDAEVLKLDCQICRTTSYEIGRPVRDLKPHYCLDREKWDRVLRAKIREAVLDSALRGGK